MSKIPLKSKTDLLSMTPDDLHLALSRHFSGRGQPDYRAGQVKSWLYQGLVNHFSEMTNLPLEERKALESAFEIDQPTPKMVQVSQDSTVKHLWTLKDGELIESVLIPTDRRLTLCISSQAGCAMACTFCATGWGGFKRQLTAGEIVGQYRASQSWANKDGCGPITNIVFMGMGEPLANQRSLPNSLTILNQGYKIGARRITVSTVGFVPGIISLAKRPEQFGLALSLHSPVSKLREELIPLEKQFPLADVLQAIDDFKRDKGRRVTLEYTMIRGINDDLDLVHSLGDIALRFNAFVNLIPFNPIPQNEWTATEPERILEFANRLKSRGVSVAVRETRGRDIDAACGQLKAHAVNNG
ncbi:MAG: 23S rRNA (adenine(2503)-C(2))-methyltransferase RlmN [Gemmatimonadetes bacterium]|jgi:23S rRNA (adenine2503-C2)-methyltransferase|nr:23S rRNA (adenine(2503)-C(2))-methyltransferase RlmN [Gemmatimonadota bacterium]